MCSSIPRCAAISKSHSRWPGQTIYHLPLAPSFHHLTKWLRRWADHDELDLLVDLVLASWSVGSLSEFLTDLITVLIPWLRARVLPAFLFVLLHYIEYHGYYYCQYIPSIRFTECQLGPGFLTKCVISLQDLVVRPHPGLWLLYSTSLAIEDYIWWLRWSDYLNYRQMCEHRLTGYKQGVFAIPAFKSGTAALSLSRTDLTQALIGVMRNS